jgi:hypothetical protein
MTYTHPKHYEGFSDNEHISYRVKQKVERICLACDKFMGKEHDFTECDYKPFKKCETCPKEEPIVSAYELNEPLKYESEE